MRDIKFEDLSKGDKILTDLYSDPLMMEGFYKKAHVHGLEDLTEINKNDNFYLETLQVRAETARKIYSEAKSNGEDLSNPQVLSELGDRINAYGLPIHKSEAIMTAIWNSIGIIILISVSAGIWGKVFNKSFLIFSIFGLIIGLLICLFSVFPVTVNQRTKERVREVSRGIGLSIGTLSILIGVLGILVLIVQNLFI